MWESRLQLWEPQSTSSVTLAVLRTRSRRPRRPRQTASDLPSRTRIEQAIALTGIVSSTPRRGRPPKVGQGVKNDIARSEPFPT